MPRGFFNYAHFRAKLGRTYYVPQETSADENTEVQFHPDERGGFNGVPSMLHPHSKEPQALRHSLLVLCFVLAVVSGSFLWIMRSPLSDYDCVTILTCCADVSPWNPNALPIWWLITILLLVKFTASILGGIGAVYRKGCLIGLVGIIMITLGLIFIILLISSTFDFLNDADEFRESSWRVYDRLSEYKEDTRIFYTYLGVVIYLIGHAAYFFLVATIAWILRTHYM